MRRRPALRAPPAKKQRLYLTREPLGFSPFFRSLSRGRLCLVTAPIPRVAAASKGKDISPGALQSGRSTSANHRTKRLPPEPSSDEDSDLDDDEDEDEQDDLVEETLQVDFEFFDPKPGDFHGVKLLLRGYLGDRQWDFSGFVDLILEQTTVGTVVRLQTAGEEEEDDHDEPAAGERTEEDDEGPYAVISVLNLGRYAGHQCIKELKEYLIEVCHEDAMKNKLQAMLEGEQAHSTGLLVCERFVNFPYQPVPHLYDALFDEVLWATEDEKTKEIRDSFHFKFYILLTRIFVKKDADIGKGRSKASSGKKNKSSLSSKGRSGKSDESVIYTKAEDEIFHELCSSSFTFDFLHKEQFVPPELKNYKERGLVMVVESHKVPTFREEVKSFLSET